MRGSGGGWLKVTNIEKNNGIIFFLLNINQGSISQTCLHAPFMSADPKSIKMQPSHQCLFALLGSTRVKRWWNIDQIPAQPKRNEETSGNKIPHIHNFVWTLLKSTGEYFSDNEVAAVVVVVVVFEETTCEVTTSNGRTSNGYSKLHLCRL